MYVVTTLPERNSKFLILQCNFPAFTSGRALLNMLPLTTTEKRRRRCIISVKCKFLLFLVCKTISICKLSARNLPEYMKTEKGTEYGIRLHCNPQSGSKNASKFQVEITWQALQSMSYPPKTFRSPQTGVSGDTDESPNGGKGPLRGMIQHMVRFNKIFINLICIYFQQKRPIFLNLYGVQSFSVLILQPKVERNSNDM